MIIALVGPKASGKSKALQHQMEAAFMRRRHTIATFKSRFSTVNRTFHVSTPADYPRDHSYVLFFDNESLLKTKWDLLNESVRDAALDAQIGPVLDWLEATHSDMWIATQDLDHLSPRLKRSVDLVLTCNVSAWVGGSDIEITVRAAFVTHKEV